jgi:HEAT repeat protein
MSTETVENGKFLELLAVAVACGATVKAAAESCGCSERHAYRISSDPAFRQRVSDLRSEMTSAAVGELSAAASEAVATLRELLSGENEPSVRMNAAKAILNALGPLSELTELRQRLEQLESGR